VWAAYQPKGAVSFAASLLDISGKGNNAGDPGGAGTPTWDTVNGWTFDGVAQYLTTTFRPSNDQTQSGICQFSGAITAGGFLFGCDQAALREFGIVPQWVEYNNGNQALVGPALAAGNLAVAGAQGYRNGAAEGAAIGAWAGATVQNLYIGCKLDTGVPGNFLQCNIQALAIYDCTLTATQISAIAARMASL